MLCSCPFQFIIPSIIIWDNKPRTVWNLVKVKTSKPNQCEKEQQSQRVSLQSAHPPKKKKGTLNIYINQFPRHQYCKKRKPSQSPAIPCHDIKHQQTGCSSNFNLNVSTTSTAKKRAKKNYKKPYIVQNWSYANDAVFLSHNKVTTMTL